MEEGLADFDKFKFTGTPPESFHPGKDTKKTFPWRAVLKMKTGKDEESGPMRWNDGWMWLLKCSCGASPIIEILISRIIEILSGPIEQFLIKPIIKEITA